MVDIRNRKPNWEASGFEEYDALILFGSAQVGNSGYFLVAGP
jgi:hypothetical protein